jgi:hypothetical protein
MQVTLSQAVPVPVPWPGVHWLQSLCVSFSLYVSEGSVWAGYSINYNQKQNYQNIELEEAIPVQKICS